MLELVQMKIFRKIGFIDEIDDLKITNKAQHYRLLKFILNNNSKYRVQVVAWNAKIERIEFHLQSN